MGFIVHKKSGKRPVTILLNFTSWGEGEVFEWLNSLDQADRIISKLQIRKDTRGLVPHRFVVLHMQSGSVHRFDRRPERRGREALEGPTKDECSPNLDLEASQDIERNTINEIELLLGDLQAGLDVIVATCFEIANDPGSRQYSLRAHNCFFFSWTIFMVAARRSLPYRGPPSHTIVQRLFGKHIDAIWNFVTSEWINLIVYAVVNVLNVLGKERAKSTESMTRDKIYQTRPIARISIFILVLLNRMQPAVVSLSFWKRVIGKSRLHRLQGPQVEETIRTRATEIFENVLTETHNILDAELWLTDLDKIAKAAVKGEMMPRLFKALFETLSNDYEDPSPGTFAQYVASRNIKPGFRGFRGIKLQLDSVLSSAVLGGLKAARMAIEVKEDNQVHQRESFMAQLREQYNGSLAGSEEAHKEVARYDTEMWEMHIHQMFDLGWKAARDGALESAKMVEEETRFLVRNSERVKSLWDGLWAVWETSFDKLQPTVSKRAMKRIDRVVDNILATYSTVLTDSIGSATVSAKIPKISSRVSHSFFKEVIGSTLL